MRKYYVDNARWIVVFLVVLYHVIYMFNGIITDGVIGPFYEFQWWDAIQYILYPWFMVVLFVIAGMSSRFYLEHHTGREYAKSRTKKLLLPGTVGLLVFGWITGYFNMAISGAFEQTPQMPLPVLWLIEAVSGTGVLWFIQVLWIYSMLLLLVRKIEKDRFYTFCAKIPVWLIILFVIPLWGAARILNAPVICVYRFGIYGLAFFIGYFVMSHDEVMERLTKFRAVFAAGSILLSIAEVWFYFGENYAVSPVRDSILSIALAWFGSLALLTFARKKLDKKNAFTEFMSAKSWQVYVFHYTAIAAAAFYMRDTQIPPLGQYLIITVAGFMGGFVLGELISRIPVIRLLVLGISKKRGRKHV